MILNASGFTVVEVVLALGVGACLALAKPDCFYVLNRSQLGEKTVRMKDGQHGQHQCSTSLHWQVFSTVAALAGTGTGLHTKTQNELHYTPACAVW